MRRLSLESMFGILGWLTYGGALSLKAKQRAQQIYEAQRYSGAVNRPCFG